MSPQSTVGASTGKEPPCLPFVFVRCVEKHKTPDGDGLILPTEFNEAMKSCDYKWVIMNVMGGAFTGGIVLLKKSDGDGPRRMEISDGWDKIRKENNIGDEEELWFSYNGDRKIELKLNGDKYETRAAELIRLNAVAVATAALKEEHPNPILAPAVVPINTMLPRNIRRRRHGISGPLVSGCLRSFTIKYVRATRTGYSPRIHLNAHPYLKTFGARPWKFRLGNKTTVWEVALEYSHGAAYFTNGWSRFIEELGILKGDALQFHVRDDADEPYMEVRRL